MKGMVVGKERWYEKSGSAGAVVVRRSGKGV